jgi:hypothetical protein
LQRKENKAKRLVFCLKAMKEKHSFENAIFTDETSIEMQQYTTEGKLYILKLYSISQSTNLFLFHSQI